MVNIEGEIECRVRMYAPRHHMAIINECWPIASEHISAGNYDPKEIAYEMIFEWEQKNKTK